MKSVVICGSRRFKNEVREFAQKLKEMGVVVHQPHHRSGQEDWTSFSEDYQKFIALGLTHDHFYKIQMADVVFIFNKDGYVGNSTTMETSYAAALGKPIYALAQDQELSRHVLFREIIKTPEELATKLK